MEGARAAAVNTQYKVEFKEDKGGWHEGYLTDLRVAH